MINKSQENGFKYYQEYQANEEKTISETYYKRFINKSKSKSFGKVKTSLGSNYLIIFEDIFKYGLVSVLATAADIGILYLLVENIYVHYMFASTTAFCFGLIFHYYLVKIFVFVNSKMAPNKEFIVYSLIGIIGLGLNNLIIYVLVCLNLWYLYAKLISVVLVFFFNFFSRRRLFT